MKKLILFGIILMALFLAGCQTEQTGDTYKIGVIYPLTGDAASYGLPIQTATQIAADEINAQGGVNGKELELIYEDGKCNPKDGNSAAQKLVNIDGVEVILGGVCSGETLGAAPTTEEGKVILLSPSATSPDVTDAGDFVFRTAPSDAYAASVASEYAFNQLNARDAAIISESTDYAQGLRRVFRDNFIELGGAVVADETYNPEDTDFRTQVTKVKASEPDVIYLAPQTTPKGVLLVRQVKEAGLDQQIVTAEVLLGRDIISENAELMEGMVGVEQKFDDNAPKSAALLEKYEEVSGEKAPFPAFMSGAYDSVYLVAQAIETQGYDGEKIRDFLNGVENYDGAVGQITFDENGDVLLDFSVKQAKGGEVVTIQ